LDAFKVFIYIYTPTLANDEKKLREREREMYVRRHLSEYRRNPSELSTPAPSGPNSGYMVIMDNELEQEETSCWGLCYSTSVKKFPFPQNKILNVLELAGEIEHDVLFIPGLDEPLSSNLYYAIHAKGRYRGYGHCTLLF